MPLSPGPIPNAILNRIMNSRNGNAMTKSANRISTWSTRPPAKPAALPYTIPTSTNKSGASDADE